MNNSNSVASDPPGQLDVPRHDRHSLRVDRAQVRVLEQAHHKRLGRLLQSVDGCRLESQVALVVGRDLSDQSLERQLSDEQLSRLLVLPDLSERDCAGPESVRLLDGLLVVGRLVDGLLARGLVGERLSGGLGAGLLSRSLLGSCHWMLKLDFLESDRVLP